MHLTFASAAGLTLPLTEKAPPKIIIWPTFFANVGSSSTACMPTTIMSLSYNLQWFQNACNLSAPFSPEGVQIWSKDIDRLFLVFYKGGLIGQKRPLINNDTFLVAEGSLKIMQEILNRKQNHPRR